VNDRRTDGGVNAAYRPFTVRTVPRPFMAGIAGLALGIRLARQWRAFYLKFGVRYRTHGRVRTGRLTSFTPFVEAPEPELESAQQPNNPQRLEEQKHDDEHAIENLAE